MIDMFSRIKNIPYIQRILKLSIILHITELVFRMTYGRKDTSLAKNNQAMKRFKQCKNKKSKHQIKKEINLCKKYWKCYPFHYFRYNLYQTDKQLTDKQLLDFIPEFFFYYLFIPYYNKREYEYLTSDKHKTQEVFSSRSIPSAQTICTLIKDQFYDNNNRMMTLESVLKNVDDKKFSQVFVKPLTGKGGKGIFIFDRDVNGQLITNTEIFFDNNFLKNIGHNDEYIIETGIQQHDCLRCIYPYSVNTFRFLTENKKQNIRILSPVFFRIGKGGKKVDNYDQGGLLTTININTGIIEDHASSGTGEIFTCHPDTNFIFKGYTVPNWNTIKNFVIECAAKIPELTFLAWDIAVTKNGPIVIEINFETGLDGLQLHSGGLRTMFGIDDPMFYWNNQGREV